MSLSKSVVSPDSRARGTSVDAPSGRVSSSRPAISVGEWVGKNKLDFASRSHVSQVLDQRALPKHVQLKLRLIDKDQRSGSTCEQDLECERQDLLFPRREIPRAKSPTTFHGDRKPGISGSSDLLVFVVPVQERGVKF